MYRQLLEEEGAWLFTTPTYVAYRTLTRPDAASASTLRSAAEALATCYMYCSSCRTINDVAKDCSPRLETDAMCLLVFVLL